MRDEVIELIEVDPSAFGASPGRGGRPSAADRRRRKLIALAVAVAAGLGTLALFDAKPWAGDGPRLTFDDSHPTTAQLSDHLLLDLPVSQVRATTLHTAPLPASRDLLASGAIGYFFGDRNATLNRSDGSDRWFGFYATPVATAPAPAPTIDNPTDSIAGEPASIGTDSNGLTQLRWGPLDGYLYTGAAANLSKNEIISLADQVRVQHTRVEVLNHAALGTMRPLGRFADYFALVNLAQRAQQNGVHLDGVVSVFYNSGGSIASMPANKSVGDMVAFALTGGTERPITRNVHGHAAYGFAQGAGAEGFSANVVLWWEGGRLILVSSEGTLDQTFALAQTAHVASDADWAAVNTVN